jgi:uncharacterized phage protein (TIGR02218 family)
MPRTIPAPLQARLDLTECSPIVLVQLTRTDGLVLRLTSWDRTVSHDGEEWDPSDGIQISAIQATASGAADDLSASGFLTDDRITEIDLLARLWDDCHVLVKLTEAGALDHSVDLFAGRIGRMSELEGKWSTEVLSLLDRLQGPLVERTSALCRCQRLGETRCGVNLAGTSVGGTAITQTGTLSASTSTTLAVAGLTAPDGYFTGGIAKITSGPNAGIERIVKSHVGSAIVVRASFPFAIGTGTTIEIQAGCDRSVATCRAKFANANRFQGEPDIPGNDAVTRRGRG